MRRAKPFTPGAVEQREEKVTNTIPFSMTKGPPTRLHFSKVLPHPNITTLWTKPPTCEPLRKIQMQAIIGGDEGRSTRETKAVLLDVIRVGYPLQSFGKQGVTLKMPYVCRSNEAKEPVKAKSS
jgi:hypothetical protein